MLGVDDRNATATRGIKKARLDSENSIGAKCS
jgi:hypothetical protein